ncbi:MAG TPA: translocation/assembly module TamB domain-containing protein, partial [Spirochaetia bacterium]|nr:translocation/assembly module TamB domain-containing protein [Spirochaetia bacterium]
LTLVTGRKVEFLWPNETLPLLRAVTATGQSLVIKANDVASTWSLVGKLALKTGEINYLNRTFVLKEGQLGFQENQAGFDPRLSVRAEYKVQESTGPVIINLRADGTLSKFAPRFDATPYKSPEELQQLVGTTLALPTDYTKAPNADAALSVASDIGTSFLMTPFEETVKKNFNLDLFTVRTEILKKTLLGRNGPLDAADYLDNTRLFFGKYIGDDLFLQGTLIFSQDQTAAAQGSPKMVVEPQVQLEFQTPLFLLDWDLAPQHPETLFVTDNTVTFRWNWSY